MKAQERFLRYITFDTQSDRRSNTCPSTEKQAVFGAALADEMRAMGIADAKVDANGYVYGAIPSSPGAEWKPALGLIAHMDTAMDMSGADIKARTVRCDGGDIVLNEARGIVTRAAEYPALTALAGQDIIVTDGTTLLGADNKAGIAEILTLAEQLLTDPTLPHPAIKIAFTPDEEIGRGADRFDLKRFGAEWAYTIDGGALGEVEYENFNAASAIVTLHGVTAHTGYAKGLLRNAALIGMEFHAMLPVFDNPACTSDREGFFHLDAMEGCTETAVLRYLIRDHDAARFAQRKQLMEQAAAFLNGKYGPGTAELQVEDSYLNMYEQIKPHMHLIERADSAMRACGVEPSHIPIRGGTDGARLSYMGLPCPNLCTGGYYGHGRHELISVQAMDKVVQILTALAAAYA